MADSNAFDSFDTGASDDADNAWLEVELLYEPPLPPIAEDTPREEPERAPYSPPADPDPELGHGFTAVLFGTPIAFGAVYMAIFLAPAHWGPLGAGVLGGTFCAMYVSVFWIGAKWIESHR